MKTLPLLFFASAPAGFAAPAPLPIKPDLVVAADGSGNFIFTGSERDHLAS